MSKHLKSIAGMSLGTLFSRLTGFAKWAALGAALGFSPLADAYNLAHILPSMIYELILGGILSAVFIPVVVEQLTQFEPEQAWRNVSQVVNAGLAIIGAATVLCFAFSPLLVYFQTLKADPATRHLVLFFFLFFIPQIFFYGLSAIGGGILNARDRFAIVAYAPVLNNLIVIGTLAAYRLWPWFGNTGLAVGTSLGVLIQAMVLYPSLKSSGFRYHWSLDFGHPAVRKVVKLSGPVILYVIFNQLNLTVQNNLAINIPGGVSALQYAFAFYILPHGLFAVSIGTVLLPGLSGMAVKNDWQRFAATIKKGIIWSALVIMPALAAYVSLSLPIVQTLMQHGRFTGTDSRILSTVLSCYSLGLFSFTLYLFLNRAFYALQDTTTPLMLNFTGNAVNSGFNFLVVGWLGIPGLALGHALAYTVIAALSLWLIKRRVGELDLGKVGVTLARITAASLVLGLAGWITNLGWQRYIGRSEFGPKVVYLSAVIMLLAGLYLGLARIFKIEELTEMIKTLTIKAGRKGEENGR
jgi:putative peptidoglycan lipid II flippase